MTALVDRWSVRGSDASVAFRGRASRFTPTFAARFTSVTGTLSHDLVDVEVHVGSLTTGNAAYDELLAKVDPFDVTRHPVARYRSTAVTWRGSGAVVEGELSLRGRTSPVTLQASYVELEPGVARLSASGRVDRRAYGLRLEVPGCGVLVPNALDLSIDVVAVPAIPRQR